MAIIYHLTNKADWEEAGSGPEYRAESLALEGFIHCSKDEQQALAVANRLFSGQAGLLLLEVDTGRLRSPVKHEPARSGEIYPHIYGPLNVDAVVGILPLDLGADGGFSITRP